MRPTRSTDFRLLGPISLVRDGAEVSLGGPQQRALLALLLINRGQRVSTDVLADALWQGQPPAGFRTTMRSYVSRLRHVLRGDAQLASLGSAYALHLEPGMVDAHRFEQLADEGNQALGRGALAQAVMSFSDALDLWHGPALGGDVDAAALRVEADRLEQLRLLVLERHAEAGLGLGRAPEVAEELMSLVRIHPFRERLWRLLMLSLYHSERQAEALEVYREARDKLAEELGLEPSDQLRDLEQAILRQEVTPLRPPHTRHTVPAAVSSFVGREKELAEVTDLVARSRLVTLTGVGGVGKTRAALEAAGRLLIRTSDGAYFCDLAGLADPAQLVPAVARVYDARGIHPDDGLDGLVHGLRDTDSLLVLDNCEHLAAACADLAGTLLSECPGLRVLATSRTGLGIPGEVEYPLPPLSLTTEAAGASEAVELLLARARAARPGLATGPAALDAAARICAELDGLPLAIELAAARARSLSLEEIASRISDRFRFLVSWRRLTPARHQTLQEAMDWSHDLLSDEERSLLARMSVFAGGCTLDAVAEVCLDGDEQSALALVDRLVADSLVVAHERHGITRYGMLETVRQYAAERLAERSETTELRDRHARHVLGFAESSWSAQIDALDHWATVMTTELLNLQAALNWCRDSDRAVDLARLVAAVWRYWWISGDVTAGRGWLDSALAREADLAPSVRAELHEGSAGLSWAQGDLDRADRHARAGLALFESAKDTRGTLACLIVLGHVALNRDRDFRRAEQLFERGRRLADEGELRADAAVVTHNLGSVAFAEGDLPQAAARYYDALTQYNALHDGYGAALSELYLGLVAADDERDQDAADHLGRALPVFREMGFRQYAGQCLDGIAAVARARGHTTEAVRLLASASVLRERTGHAPDHSARLRDREIAAARAALGDDRFATAWAEGRALGEEGALERALAVVRS